MLSPNGVRAILFDLDGTLRYNRPSSIHAFLDYAARLGLEDTPEKRRQVIRWVHRYWSMSAEMLEDAETYRGQEDQFWINHSRKQLVRFGCEEARAADLAGELQKYMRDHYQPQDCVPEDVPGTLEQLRQAGFFLAVLSNRDKPCGEYLGKLGIGQYFEAALVAGELESWKPDPLIFQRALERLNLRPEEVVYVGDNYYADVVGSSQAGLRPVLIDPEGVFPEAGCAVIRAIGELPGVLAGE